MTSPSRGFGLIEVMIAVLVLAIGMLGVASLQAVSLRNTQSSMDSSQAVFYTYAIIDAMRANRASAVIGGYDLADFACNPPAEVEEPANGNDLAKNDLHDWIESIQRNVNEGACAQVSRDGDVFIVSVRWDDSRGTEGDNARIVTTRAVL
jgi:type IV pilus assembly protein PilV